MKSTLLQQRDAQRRDRRRESWNRTRVELRRVLGELVPGESVLVFGSLTRPEAFGDASDVDLALFSEPPGKSLYSLQAEFEERMERRVDLILLEESRFKDNLLREGERWTG
ncbi:MAG: nucleotidyltransferase domain-containing protein [Chthoniobacterales bacterium]